MLKKLAVMLATLSLLIAPAMAQGTQLNSTASTVSLSMTVNESVTVSATPSAITFTYNPVAGTAAASGPISVTTSWNAGSGRFNVGTFAYLSSATASLGGPSNIASSSVTAQINSGSFVPCNLIDTLSVSNSATSLGFGVANAFCPVVFQNSTSGLSLAAGQGTNTSTITLALNGLSNTLAAGTYSGTLNIEATLM